MTLSVEPERRVLLRNGSIYSPVDGTGTAMLCIGPTIATVGNDESVLERAGEVDEVIDLDGRLVTPAFVDAHVHLSMTGRALASLDLADCGSLAEALVEIEAYASGLPEEAVVFASGWDESTWPDRRAPSLAELDGAAGGRIVYAARVDSHSAVVSSALLTSNPDIALSAGWRGDGTVERDAHHAARAVVRGLWTVEERTEALRRALRFAASQGIGCVHEVNAPHIAPFDDFALIAELTASEPLPTVVGYWGELLGGEVDAEAVSGYAGDLNVDGSIGSHTAYLRDSYADAPTRGYGYLTAEQIGEHVAYCTDRNLQAGFHVIGDAALDAVVDGLRLAAAEVGREEFIRCRHRLEHVEMPSAEVTDTIAELGVVASVQPAFDAAWGAAGQLYEQRLGATRARRMNPFASFHDAGVVLAFGSDSPVTPMNPWAGVRAAVFHSNPDERLDVRTAFDAATAGGHRAGRRDDVGVLTPGSPATYAVWEAPTPLDRGLPNLTGDGPLPSCISTVVDGAPIFSTSEGKR